MARRSEENDMQLIGYTDVAGFAGVENGSAVIKPLEVSVNKDMAGLPTKFSQRIHGERIEVYKRQLPAYSSGQMSAVEKQFKEVQKPFEQITGKMGGPSKDYENDGNYSEPVGKDGLTPLAVLKNMVDNHANDIRNFGNWTKIAILLGGIGLAGFVLSLGIALK
jgi:hypothetical protein